MAMKSWIFCVLLGVASAARLDNKYVPPPANAVSASGSSFVQAPANQYGPPGFVSQGAFATNQPAYFGGASRQNSRPYDAQATILRYNNNPNKGDGSYSFDYQTSNGISQQEQGYHRPTGPEQGEQIVTGQYSYTGDDGRTYTVQYKADSNGFQAYGDHLPTPPPIPPEILKSLELTARGSQQYPGYQGAFSQQQPAFNQRGGYPAAATPQQQYLPPNRRFKK